MVQSCLSLFLTEPDLTRIAQEQGHADAAAFVRVVLSDFHQLVDNHWVDIN